jgi:ubiquinone/menaquinone biosynthesis C-methylase UbiE
MKWLVRTTEEERAWERQHMLKQIDRYLATDVMDKISKDEGYRAKIDLVEERLTQSASWILDIGSNTAGECEYLVSRGYSIIATDINEQALLISQRRCRHFGRKAPAYVACDGQRLPFESGSVACAVFNESLHHMPDPAASLREVHRVLQPGGKVLMYEPYAYDPWRRISEVRDYFRGTVETSFGIGQLRELLRQAGLSVTDLSRPALPPSQWKLDALPFYRRALPTTPTSTQCGAGF